MHSTKLIRPAATRPNRLIFTLLGALLASAGYAGDLSLASCEAPGTSHELEEAATALHDYLHENYDETHPDAGAAAHTFEEAAATTHDLLHDIEQRQIDLFSSDFRAALRDSGLGDTDEAVIAWVVSNRPLFSTLSGLVGCGRPPFPDSLAQCDAIGTSHDAQDAAGEIHDYLHDHYDATHPDLVSAAHGLEDGATALHDALHETEESFVEYGEAFTTLEAVLIESGLVDQDPDVANLLSEAGAAMDELDDLVMTCD